MQKDYAWDEQAVQGIKNQKLDAHFEKHVNEYLDIVRPVWKLLCTNNLHPLDLKSDDLFAPLLPILERAGIVQNAMKAANLPQHGQRGSPKWLCWFTYYVVEQCLTPSSKAGTVARFRIKNLDKIKQDVAAEIKAKKMTPRKPSKKPKKT
jgi:hypothetical protein